LIESEVDYKQDAPDMLGDQTAEMRIRLRKVCSGNRSLVPLLVVPYSSFHAYTTSGKDISGYIDLKKSQSFHTDRREKAKSN
jgi:hypothetical protein